MIIKSSQIKYAFDIESPIPGVPAEVKAPIGNAPSSGGGAAVSNPATSLNRPSIISTPYVTKMQEVMIDIRQIISSTSIFSAPQKPIKITNQPEVITLPGIKSPNPNQIQTESDTTQFASRFLAPLFNRILPKGEQNKSSDEEDSSQKAWSIVNRMKDLAVLGKRDSKGNPIPDGIWGDATTQGLMAISDVLSAFSIVATKLNFEDDDAITVPEAKGWLSFIPKQKNAATTSAAQWDSAAKNIYSALMTAKNKVENFISRIIGVDFINNHFTEPLATGYMAPPLDAPLDASNYEMPGFSTHFISDVLQDPYSQVKAQTNLSLSDLLSPSNIRDYIKKNNITVNGKSPLQDADDPSILNEFLDYLKQGIKNKTLRIQIAPRSQLPQATR